MQPLGLVYTVGSMAELFFGEFRFDTKHLRLEGPQGEVEVRAKTLQLLTYLIENRNRFVARDELMRELWKDVRVTAASVTQCISELRQHLGDSAKEPVYVETRVKYGYRFVAPLYYRPTEQLEPLPPPPEIPSAQLSRGSDRRRWLFICLAAVPLLALVAAAFLYFGHQESGPLKVFLAAPSLQGSKVLTEPAADLVFTTLEEALGEWNDVVLVQPVNDGSFVGRVWVLELSVAELHGRRLKVSADLVWEPTGKRSWAWSSLIPAEHVAEDEFFLEVVAEVKTALEDLSQ